MKRLAALLLVLVVAGCGAPEAGIITNKRYQPADDWVTYASCGNGCTFPVFVHDPERWQLRLLNGKKEGWRTVSQGMFLEAHIGGTYP